MNYSVTLQTLRKYGACYNGYNKVVRALQGKEFTKEDKDRESYIRFNHKEEIPLSFILKSNGFDDTIWALRCFEGIKEAERDARLFAVWCARQVQHLMKDKRSIKALEVAKKFANEEASREELEVAYAAARAAVYNTRAAVYNTRAAVYAASAAAPAAAYNARAASVAASVAAYAAAYNARAAAYDDVYDAYYDVAAPAAAHKAQQEMLLLMLENKAPWQI